MERGSEAKYHRWRVNNAVTSCHKSCKYIHSSQGVESIHKSNHVQVILRLQVPSQAVPFVNLILQLLKSMKNEKIALKMYHNLKEKKGA